MNIIEAEGLEPIVLDEIEEAAFRVVLEQPRSSMWVRLVLPFRAGDAIARLEAEYNRADINTAYRSLIKKGLVEGVAEFGVDGTSYAHLKLTKRGKEILIYDD